MIKYLSVLILVVVFETGKIQDIINIYTYFFLKFNSEVSNVS